MNNKLIVLRYLKTWFSIDLLTSVPVNLFASINNSDSEIGVNSYHNLTKITRLPKLYRLLKLVKMFRLINFVRKNKNIIGSNQLLRKMKIHHNIEKLLIFFFAICIFVHISSCIWYLIAKFNESNNNNWLLRFGFLDYEPFDIYVVCVYYTLMTITTVGYGDIYSGALIEIIYNLMLMLGGVIIYSFAISSLTNIVTNLDMKNAITNNKLVLLKNFKKEFKIDEEVYNNVRKFIKSEKRQVKVDENSFLKILPIKLKLGLTKLINNKLVNNFYFFKNSSINLISYISENILPQRYYENEFILKENEIVTESNFIIKVIY
jgi:hypothetical protein